MYRLPLVAAVFLPPGLPTGPLGINVGGTPGANNDAAFLAACGILAASGALPALGLRWKWRL